MYSGGRQCAYTVDAATMRKQGKKQAEEEKKACSVADPDPFGPELICQIRIQINNQYPDPNLSTEHCLTKVTKQVIQKISGRHVFSLSSLKVCLSFTTGLPLLGRSDYPFILFKKPHAPPQTTLIQIRIVYFGSATMTKVKEICSVKNQEILEQW